MSAELLLELNQMTQWNKDVKHTFQCKDHGGVRGTSYMEIHELLGTSGCSAHYPYWTWNVCGIIRDHNKNKLVVSPGDWILEKPSLTEGGGTLIFVIHDVEYQALIKKCFENTRKMLPGINNDQ